MSRPYAWVLNLDAELELARGRPGYVAQRKLTQQLSEHGAASRRLLADGDLLLEPAPATPESLPPLDRGRWLGRAWCPTPLAIVRLRAHAIEPEPHPPADVLRRVNHRLFSHELGGGLFDQSYLQSRGKLLDRLGDGKRRWLLKRPLTFAGRGQLRVIGPITEKQWTWVDASLKRDGLICEPLVTPTFEVSVHGFVWRDGRYELGRPCAQLVGPRGAFRGVRLAEPDELSSSELGALYGRAEAVARALFVAGYFGPFGIDAYRYELDGTTGFCALGEINARYTLGFVTGIGRTPSDLVL